MALIVERRFEDMPIGVSIDWPIIALSNRPEFHIDKLFGRFKIRPSTLNEDGLGPRKSVLFEMPRNHRWFFAHQSPDHDGIVFETSGNTDVDLFEAAAALMDALGLHSSDCSWMSDFVTSGHKHIGRAKQLPQFSVED